MSVPLAVPERSCDQPFDPATHQVVCLVKRHLYELAFAVPHAPRPSAGGAQPCLYMRMKRPEEAGGFRLNLEDIECLAEDLLRMMEYVQHEHQRMGLSKSIA